MSNKPTSVSELFPSKYLKADDLHGKAYTLQIARVEVEQMHSRFSGQDEWKAVVYFANAERGLVLNVTNAHKLAEICGSEVFSVWVGKTVGLRPATFNGKPTVQVFAVVQP